MDTPHLPDVKLAELQDVRQITLIQTAESEYLLQMYIGCFWDQQQTLRWDKTQANAHFLPLTSMKQVEMVVFFLQLITEQKFIEAIKPTANVRIWRREDETKEHRKFIAAQNQKPAKKL